MVIITYQMQKTMHHHSVQFFRKFSSILDGIIPDSIDTYKKVTGKSVTLTIIESDDICEVIMLKILLVDIKNIIVRTEYYGNITNAADFAFSNKTKPTVIQGFALENEICVLEIVRNHAKIFRKSTILYKKFEIKIIISNFTGQNGI